MCRAGLLAVRKTSVSGLRRSRSSEALDSFVEAAPVFLILPADFLEAPVVFGCLGHEGLVACLVVLPPVPQPVGPVTT